jgi:putative transposase
MDGMDLSAVIKFYRKVVTKEFMSALASAGDVIVRDGIYKYTLVIWLMIIQRISSDGTLSSAVEELRRGASGELLKGSRSKRVRSGKISPGTGGFSRARSRLPLRVVSATADRINNAIVASHLEQEFLGSKVYVVDGSSVRLEHSEENINAYPQCSTEKTKAHYPLARIVVATDAVTRVTLRPSVGPLHGKFAKGELELAGDVLPQIPNDSVVVADRLYGCFKFVYDVFEAKKHILTRLSTKRAHRFIGATPKDDSGEVEVTWTPSKLEAKKYTELPADAGVPGRCLWFTMHRAGFRPTLIILFTTLKIPAQQVLDMYGLRWNVEDTLRDIKSTLKMDFIHAKNPDTVQKELILGVVAYNLVRHFMAVFAKANKIPPERLSFTAFLRRINFVAPAILYSASAQNYLAAMFDKRGLLLPHRSKPRTQEPRKIWPQGDTRIFMQHSRSLERQKLSQLDFRPDYAPISDGIR